uniref:Uncharacterized protein n=1 Tax=Zooxanthella nutricula TaxID=1333877 RepID=A0A7S2JCY3_9DINO
MGHARLHRLLADPALSDVCRLEERGPGKAFVWPAARTSPPTHAAQPRPTPATSFGELEPRHLGPPMHDEQLRAAACVGEQSPHLVDHLPTACFPPTGKGVPCAPMLPGLVVARGSAPTLVPWGCKPHIEGGASPPAWSSATLQQAKLCQERRPIDDPLDYRILRRSSAQLLSPGASPVGKPMRTRDFSIDIMMPEHDVDGAVADDASTVAFCNPSSTAASTPLTSESAKAAEGFVLFVKNSFIHVAEEAEEASGGTSNSFRVRRSLPHNLCLGRRQSDVVDGAEHADHLVRAAAPQVV